MDKKKVKELMKLIHYNVGSIKGMREIDDEYKEDALNFIKEALDELSKSDWVSVENQLPPYEEEVFVTSKMSPDNVFKDRRVECTTITKDSNDFIILWEGRMAKITHWKPIEKLED